MPGPLEHRIQVLLAGALQGGRDALDALLVLWVSGDLHLATPASRGPVEDLLVERGYLQREGANLRPAPTLVARPPVRISPGVEVRPAVSEKKQAWQLVVRPAVAKTPPAPVSPMWSGTLEKSIPPEPPPREKGWSPETDPVLGPLLQWLASRRIFQPFVSIEPLKPMSRMVDWRGIAGGGELEAALPRPAGIPPAEPDAAETLLSHLLSAMPFIDPQQIANIRSGLAQLRLGNYGWAASYALGTAGWERSFWTAVGNMPQNELFRKAVVEAGEEAKRREAEARVPDSQLKRYSLQMLGRPLRLEELTLLAGGQNADISLLPSDFQRYYRYWRREGVAFTEGEFLAALQEYANEAWPVELQDEFLKDASKLWGDYVDRQKMRFAQAEADASDMARYQEAIKAGLMLEVDLPEFRQHAFLTPQAFLAAETPKRIAALKDKAEKQRLTEAIAMQADPMVRIGFALEQAGLGAAKGLFRPRGPTEFTVDYEKYLWSLAEQLKPKLKDKASVDEFVKFVLNEQRTEDEKVAQANIAEARAEALLNPLQKALAQVLRTREELPTEAFAWQAGESWAEFETRIDTLMRSLQFPDPGVVRKFIMETEWRAQAATVLGQELRPQVEQFIATQLLRLPPGERDLAGAAMRAGPLVGQLTALWKAKRVAFAGVAPGMMPGEEALFKGWLGAQDPLLLIPSLSAQPQAKLAAPGRFVRTVQMPGLPPQRR